MASFEKRTLEQQIQTNLRASLFYSVLLIILLAALGGVIAGYFAPQYLLSGAAVAAALGLIIALLSWLAGPQIVLAVSHARDATPYELQVVHNVSEEVALAAGLPKPEVYVIDDPAPNAFSTGKDPTHSSIVVTTGLLQKLDRDELQGVVAHEMAHIRNQDVRFMTTLAIVAGLIPLLADFFAQMIWFSGGSRSRREDNNQSSAGVIMIVGIALAILAPIFAKLLELAVSRHREYLADATAIQFTRYPEGLVRALQKIAKDEDTLTVKNRALEHMFIVNPYTTGSEMESLFSTHPPLEARMKNLQQIMGQFPTDPASTKS